MAVQRAQITNLKTFIQMQRVLFALLITISLVRLRLVGIVSSTKMAALQNTAKHTTQTVIRGHKEKQTVVAISGIAEIHHQIHVLNVQRALTKQV